MSPGYYSKYKLGEEAKRPTKELGYILGVLCGDAYISAHAHRKKLALVTTKKEWAETFVQALIRWCLLTPKTYEYDAYHKVHMKTYHYYCVELQSREVVDFLMTIGVFGTWNWRVPDAVVNGEKVIKAGFLSGFFDSEGNANYYFYNKQYKNRRFRLVRSIRAYSSNKEGIMGVKSLLEDFHINSTIKARARNRRVLKLKQSLANYKRFSQHVNFQIPSKQQNLRKVLTSYEHYSRRPLSNEILGVLKEVLTSLELAKLLNAKRVQDITNALRRLEKKELVHRTKLARTSIWDCKFAWVRT